MLDQPSVKAYEDPFGEKTVKNKKNNSAKKQIEALLRAAKETRAQWLEQKKPAPLGAGLSSGVTV